MRLKTGVQLSGLQPEMVVALYIMEPILTSYGQELVITSCTDGKHSKKSRHYIGYGIDLRSRDLPQDSCDAIASEMLSALGAEFYVAFESNHFHIQFNGSPR